MKKLFRLLAAGLLAGLVISSCNKDVTDNSYTDQNPVVRNLGALLLTPEEFAQLPAAPVPEVDLRLKAAVSIPTPPVGDQGSEGSCVAWGTTYAGRSIEYHGTGSSAYSFDTNIFSPEYVYDHIKVSDCSSGAYVSTGLAFLVNTGVCLWNVVPYSDENGCDEGNTTAGDASASTYKISSWAAVKVNLTAIKSFLATGKSVIVAGPVNMDFMYLANNKVLTKYKGRTLGGHCYCVVGYDDTKNAFKFINSWGPSWASGGYGWIDYKFIGQWWSEAYVIYN